MRRGDTQGQEYSFQVGMLALKLAKDVDDQKEATKVAKPGKQEAAEDDHQFVVVVENLALETVMSQFNATQEFEQLWNRVMRMAKKQVKDCPADFADELKKYADTFHITPSGELVWFSALRSTCQHVFSGVAI